MGRLKIDEWWAVIDKSCNIMADENGNPFINKYSKTLLKEYLSGYVEEKIEKDEWGICKVKIIVETIVKNEDRRIRQGHGSGFGYGYYNGNLNSL